MSIIQDVIKEEHRRLWALIAFYERNTSINVKNMKKARENLKETEFLLRALDNYHADVT